MKPRFLSGSTPQEHGAKRSALLRLAILSSSLSKVFGLVLQAISIPLVYRSLGQHQYDLYLLLTGALSTISLVQMGAGPGLTQGIAKANAAGDLERAASLLRAAFRLAGATALIGCTLILAVIYLVPTDTLFGPAFAADRVQVLLDAKVCVSLLALLVLSGVVDSALAGYQEQFFIHLGTTAANILCIGLLVLVCRGGASIIGVVLVLFGIPILPKVVNFAVLTRRRPYLLKNFLRSGRGSYAVLLNVGMAFWAIEVGGMLEQNSGNYILAHLSSVQATALFAVTFKTLGLTGAVVSIVTMPLWPAFTDAMAHHDVAWISRAYRNIRLALVAYSCAVAAVVMAAGEWLFRHFMHVDTTGSGPLFVILGLYFIATVWTHLYYVTLMGMDGIWKVAVVVFAEKVLIVIVGILLVPRWGAAGMALAYLAAGVALPVWVLPIIMQRSIRRISVLPAMTSHAAARSDGEGIP